ncbi:MAG: hypothetical protein AABY68_10015 [Pseudomonadota bacterium]
MKYCGGDKARAVDAYTHNMLISEAFIPVLHVLEVALRNGIHQRMSSHYGRDDWYEAWVGDSNFNEQLGYVQEAKRKLAQRREAVSTDKVVAELNFGFWVSLFNRKIIHDTSKPLMLSFPRCPKAQRRPEPIRSKLNKIRNLRNRCFHHEPMVWMPLHALHTDAHEVIKWISPDLQLWLSSHDRLPMTFHAWRAWTTPAATQAPT